MGHRGPGAVQDPHVRVLPRRAGDHLRLRHYPPGNLRRPRRGLEQRSGHVLHRGRLRQDRHREQGGQGERGAGRGMGDAGGRGDVRARERVALPGVLGEDQGERPGSFRGARQGRDGEPEFDGGDGEQGRRETRGVPRPERTVLIRVSRISGGVVAVWVV